VLGTSLLWRSTVVFTYLKVKSAKCLCLLPVVLVLSFWSWSCKQRSWSWSCYFGPHLGLKNLVLFASLAVTTNKTTPSFLQAGWPSCRPTNNVIAPKGKAITFHGLAQSSVIFYLPETNFDTIVNIKYKYGRLPEKLQSSSSWSPVVII